MSWPTPQDYSEALQTPRLTFADSDLRAGSAEVTSLGLPRPITGNFASVYRVRCSGRDWAVRCFWRDLADMRQRYDAISESLRRLSLEYTVGFEYQPEGIRIRGTWYPVLKMEWADGELLSEYVASSLSAPNRLHALAEQWLEMVACLERAGIAHGDFQHGNVIVHGGSLRLVDYDGMYVPALAGRGSHELGHPNYQHPRRTAQLYYPGLDRFSSWVIYLSLVALSVDPELWSRHNGGDECLLVRRKDFDLHADSSLIALARHTDKRVRVLADHVIASVATDPISTPSLTETVRATQSAPRRPVQQREVLPQSRLPEWVAEALESSPTRPFQLSTLPARVAGGVAAAGGAACLVWPSAPVLAGTWPLPALCACFALLLLPLLYILDPAVRHGIKVRIKMLVLHSCLLALRVWVAHLQRRVVRAQLRFDARLQALATRESRALAEVKARRDCKVQEIEQCEALLRTWLAEAAAYHTQVLALTLEAARELVLSDALHRRRVLFSAELDISPLSRLRLLLAGIRSAADVTVERVVQLYGIDARTAVQVISWRARSEQATAGTLPTALSANVQGALDRQHRRRCAALERDLHRTAATRGAIEAKAAGKASALTSEYERNKVAAHSSYAHKTAPLLARLDSAETHKRRTNAAICNLNHDLDMLSGATPIVFMRTVFLPRSRA